MSSLIPPSSDRASLLPQIDPVPHQEAGRPAREEEFDFQMAIERSFTGNPTRGQVEQIDSKSGKNPAIPNQLRTTIDDMVKNLLLRKMMEFPLIQDPAGDTWVFIDAPPMQPEQDRFDYESYKKRCSRPHLMKKENLDKLNSPVIEQKLGPTEQFRVSRRRNLTNKLPHNVKYVLDLTPPTEGDDAVWYTTSLCCCEGIRLWYLSTLLWSVSTQMVGGEEEYTSLRSSTATMKRTTTAVVGNATPPKKEPLCEDSMRDLTPMAPEYTPIRHHMAIERVLATAQGTDPKIDSAPKFWTTFAVARYLGIVESPLTDYFVRWLRAAPNSNFIDVLPEISFIVADHLRVHNLARDSFAILVGEEALDAISASHDPKTHRRTSTFGRKKEDLPELLQTRVQYAAQSFADRIMSEYIALAGGDMRWLGDLPEFQKLLSWFPHGVKEIVDDLKSMLEAYVGGTINEILQATLTDLPRANLPQKGGEKLVPRVDRADVWLNLSSKERILSRSFWHVLRRSENIFAGGSNLSLAASLSNRGGRVAQMSRRSSNLPWTKYRIVTKRELSEQIELINETQRLPLAQDDSTENLLQDRGMPSNAGTQDPAQHIVEYNLDEQRLHIREDGTTNTTEQQSAESTIVSHSTSSAVPRLSQSQNLPIRTQKPKFLEHEDQPWRDGVPHSSSRGTEKVPYSWDDGTVPSSSNADMDPVNARSSIEKTPPNYETVIASGDDSHRSRLSAFRQESDISANLPTAHLGYFFDDFDLTTFFGEAEQHIRCVANKMLGFTDQHVRDDPHHVDFINTLVCLDDNEFKYLPLWAGGNDDGSNGVYTNEVPIPEVGFSTAGPGIHSGTSSHTPSDFDMMSAFSASDRNTSTATNAGYSDELQRFRVYATDSVDESSTGDDFSIIDDSRTDTGHNGEPPLHTGARMEVDESGSGSQSGKEKASDEDYNDIFFDDDEDSDDTMVYVEDDGDDDDEDEDDE